MARSVQDPSKGSAASRVKSKSGKAPRRRKAPPARSRGSHQRRVPSAFFQPERLALAAILLLALILRVYRLMSNFPIVGDESIYLRWAEIIQHQGQWFISLLDGKQPLSYWLYALTRFAWDGDPLLAARLISAAAGVLACLGIHAIGKRLSGSVAGLLGALFYAVLPWAIMYDRLAFTEALVNLSGVVIVYATIVCFQSGEWQWRTSLAAGLALGLGFFFKSTALMFSFFPALAGIWWSRRRIGLLGKRLAVVYGVALVFPIVSWVATPDVPTFETTNPILHQSFFFAKPAELWQNPLVVAPQNFTRFLEYVPDYVTWPAAITALASLLYLSWRRRHAVWLLASVSLLPLLVEIFILKQMFPTRYPFPHIWPWLAVTGWAAAEVASDLEQRWGRPRTRLAVGATVTLLAAGPMLAQSMAILRDPKKNISPHDSGYFLGTGAHAGFGVREAIDFLRGEARNEGFVLLVDPIWSVPADAIFPYLNQRYGIRVYEAWWTQLSGTQAIMPNGAVDLLRSHYERVKGGELDFRDVKRVFYVTDTNYYTPQAVKIRQPTAQLLRRFPKPGGQYFVDVYRLK